MRSKDFNFNHEGVDVCSSTIRIPSYVLGAEDTNPPLFEKGVKKIYPYKWKNSFTEKIVDKEYDAVIINSPWMEVTLLSDWGFHLYRAKDKMTGRDMFFCPKVMKPANNAIRGAYQAGGVEFNFPVGHNSMTYDRVELNVVKNKNGISVLFYNVDRSSGMSLAAGITITKDFRGLIFDQYMVNPTPLSKAWYYWLNAGIAPDKSLSFVFPCKSMLGHFEGPFLETRKRYDFPCFDGVDYGRNSEVPEPIGLFGLGNMSGWFGAWYNDWDFGVGRWAAPWKVGGQKYWSWGNSEEGLLWGKIAADNDLPIPEIQSGRPEVQMDRGILHPFSFTSHREWWVPISGTGDLKSVSRHGGLNVTGDGRNTTVKISPSMNESKCGISVNGQELEGKFDLKIGHVVERCLPFPCDKVKTLKIKSSKGTILEWSSGNAAESVNVNTLIDRHIPLEEMNAESICGKGWHADRIQHPETARYFYLKALEKDTHCSKANFLLGLQSLNSEDIAAALKYFKNVLEVDRLNEEALYFHGLASLWNNDHDQAIADFSHLAATGHEFVTPAIIHLIRDAFVNKEFEKLEMLLEDGTNSDPGNPLLLFFSSVYHRIKGDTASVASICDKLDVKIGVNLFARWERHFAGIKDPIVTIAPENYTSDSMLIAAALNYYQIGRVEESLQLLGMCESDEGRTEADYLSRFLLGNKQKDRKSPALFFAHGREMMKALTLSLKENPGDLAANFGLGCLLANLGRTPVAISNLLAAAEMTKGNSVVNCALGRVYMKEQKYELAVKALETAISSEELNPLPWVELDKALGVLKRRDKSWLKRFSSAPKAILENDDARKSLASLCCDHGQYDTAAGLLDEHVFYPYELSHELRNLRSRIFREKAIELSRRGQHAEALKAIKTALEYPHNLQLGKPFRTYDAGTLFAAGLICEKTGDRSAANEFFKKAAAEYQPDPTGAKPWSALAELKLGNEKEAIKKLNGIIKDAKGHLDACVPIELNNDLEEIIQLCSKFKRGWMPELEDIKGCRVQ